MRISDWSSDVCSSDLLVIAIADAGPVVAVAAGLEQRLAGPFRRVERRVRRSAVILRRIARRQRQRRATEQRGRKDLFRHIPLLRLCLTLTSSLSRKGAGDRKSVV